MKYCITCKQEKPLEEFYLGNNNKRQSSSCKECQKKYHQQWHQNNKEINNQKAKAYYQSNRIEQLQKSKQYLLSHQEERASWNKQYYQKNRERINSQAKNYYQKNKIKAREYSKQYKAARPNLDLKYKHNMTLEQYNILVNNQQGLCMICKKIPQTHSKKLCVDHDHITGKIRGLLCSKCNFGLGHFKDSIINIQRAIIYLEKQPLGIKNETMQKM